MAREEQRKRRLSGATGLPGEHGGRHLVAMPGKTDPRNCGGCVDGKRIEQTAKVVRIKTRRDERQAA